ncbi:MAG TPA: cytochrome c oxidase subunit II [Mycobacteriales bacterium]|nr:cytochrome c oxidase subunit II [Mycobacteriales bacterium]
MPARRRTAIKRFGISALGLVVFALATTGCSGAAKRIGFPDPVTLEGKKTLNVWYGSFTTACIVGGFVIILILWAALWYRRRSPDQLPRQVRYNLPIEVLYTMIPVVIVSILFYFTAIRENDMDNFKGVKLNVGVVGFQWSWQFNYLQDGLSVTGRPGEPPQLVVPVGEKIRFYETSPDVIHAWWVIPFLFKRDVIPGRVNSFAVTVDKAGVFQGKCTEYCGIDHDRMLFTVKAVSPADFQTWLAQTKSIAAAGQDSRYSVYTGPAVPAKNQGSS